LDKIKELTKLDEIKAFSVPYRMKILDCMYSFKAPATVKNIADRMGETPAKIYYHIKIMEDAGIVHLV
jgi:predicted transcriptional regulator